MVIYMVMMFYNLKYVREDMGDDREGRMSSRSVHLCARQEGCAYPIRNWKALKVFLGGKLEI